MIVESVMNLFSSTLKLIFGWINFPEVPEGIHDLISQLFELLQMGMSLVYCFVDYNTVVMLFPLVIVVANFDKMYKLVMFVLRKIPFLGIK